MYYNTETTLYMSEGEIVETLGRIRGMIKRLRERGSDTTALEWDLCYVQREADMRQARAEAWRGHPVDRSHAPAEATQTSNA